MKTLAKICGGLGLLFLLSSPVTLAVSDSNLLVGVKAITGALLIGFYLATHSRGLVRREKVADPSRPAPLGQGARASFFYLSTLVIGLLAVGGLSALNFIVARRAHPVDFTSKKIHSLAPQSVSTLKELKEPVTVTAFIPVTHPEYARVEALFEKYAAESEKFQFRFKDPAKNPDLAQQFNLKQGQMTVVLSRGVGPKANHTSLDVLSEQDLTNALLKINQVGEQHIYFLMGHGEWNLDAEAVAPETEAAASSAAELKLSLLKEGYAPQSLNLMAAQNQIPRDAALVVIAGARTPYTAAEVIALRTYLDEGGRLLYFAEHAAEPELDALLSLHGVQVDPGLLADTRTDPAHPYWIYSPHFSDHDITRLNRELQLNVLFPLARGLSVIRAGTAPGVTSLPLVLTSKYAWVETAPSEEPAPGSGEKQGQIPMVIASTRGTGSAANKRYDEARLVVFGDADLLVDANWGHEGNRNLVLNAVAWASSQVNKITVRPPDRDLSTVDIDAALLAKLRFISIDLLPTALIGIGLAIWVARRSK
jgi:ABC-type uncharacterized transport system involved in gliding motility auxiliary subunit